MTTANPNIPVNNAITEHKTDMALFVTALPASPLSCAEEACIYIYTMYIY